MIYILRMSEASEEEYTAVAFIESTAHHMAVSSFRKVKAL